MTQSGMRYDEATRAVRYSLGVVRRAAIDVLRTKNPAVDEDRLALAVHAAGGYERFVTRLAGLARAGKLIEGLSPEKFKIRTKRLSTSHDLLAGALNPEAASATLVAESSVGTSNGSPLCNTSLPNGQNNVANYGFIATASLLEVVGVPIAADEGVAGMLLASVGVSNTSPYQAQMNNVVNELNCISAQINYLEDQLDELSTLTDYDTFETEMGNANACASALSSGIGLYLTLASGATNQSINSANTDLCGAPPNSKVCTPASDLATWQSALNTCGTIINNTLFGTGGDGGGSAWAELNIYYQSQYKWYTTEQVQALQSYLSYWGTMLYYQFLLQNEVYNFYGEWANAIADSGAPGNGSKACAYSTSTTPPPGTNFCAWQSFIQYAFPPNLFSDEIGFCNGTSVNPYPGGLVLHGSTAAFNTEYLANLGLGVNGRSNWTYNFSVASDANQAFTQFNSQGINPAHNPGAMETYDSPQAYRTGALSSNQIFIAAPVTGSSTGVSCDQNSGGLSQAQTTSGSETPSTFFFNAINQINGWPASQGYSASTSAYYTSDNQSKIQGWWHWYPQGGATIAYESITVTPNATLASSITSSDFQCEYYPSTGTQGNCNYVDGDSVIDQTITLPVMGFLMQRDWWPAAGNATNQSFYTTLPYPPPSVPNSPVLTSLTAGQGQISVAFDAVSSSDDGGMPIIDYVATCTPCSFQASNNLNCYVAKKAKPVVSVGASSPIAVEGLKAVPYTCSIQARNAGGRSLSVCPEKMSCVVSPWGAVAAPDQPQNLTATPGCGDVSLAFDAPSTDGGAPISGYWAKCVSKSSGATAGLAQGQLSPLIVRGMSNGETYSCSVVAANAAGKGAPANIAFTMTGSSPPDAPKLLGMENWEINKVSGGSALLTLGFYPSFSRGCASISQYLATCESLNAPHPITLTGSAPSSVSSISISGGDGTGGYSYSCSVRAQNTYGLSNPSNTLSKAPN